MSTVAIKVNGGTPFEQFNQANKRQARLAAKPTPMPRVAKPARQRAPRARLDAPARSLAQRMAALQLANDIRSRRAELKRDLKAGRCWAVDLLVAPPEYALTMKVIDMLMATPKVGWVKANKWLSLADASQSKTLGGLSGRQRTELVALLGGPR